MEVWRAYRHAGREVWRRGRVDAWKEIASSRGGGSSGGGRNLWRRLEAVEGSG
jgi:hypothetical protein